MESPHPFPGEAYPKDRGIPGPSHSLSNPTHNHGLAEGSGKLQSVLFISASPCPAERKQGSQGISQFPQTF